MIHRVFFFVSLQKIFCMSILNKYVWLIDTVSRAGSEGITFEEICRKYQYADAISGGSSYNIRTFHNHRKDIEEIFGIEICCDTDGYRYYIADEDEIKGMSRFRQWLLSSVSVNNVLVQNKKICERILLEEIPSAEQSLPTWLTAIHENRKARFDYSPFWTNDVIHYAAFIPLCIKLFKRRWYVVGYCGNKKERIYSIDRMTNVELEVESFVLPHDYDAGDFFSGAYGVYVDKSIPVEIVKLKATPSRANYLRSLPLHISQKEVKRTDEYSLFCLSIRPTSDFIQEILSYGDSVEVLSPVGLRDTVKEKISQMCEMYAKEE